MVTCAYNPSTGGFCVYSKPGKNLEKKIEASMNSQLQYYISLKAVLFCKMYKHDLESAQLEV